MTIIAYSGSHGTGKTTSAFNQAMHFKYNHPDKSVSTMTDQEALCPFPINQAGTTESQLWIFSNHIRQELILSRRFDVLVTDRTIVDVIAYTYALGFDALACGMMAIAESYMSMYAEIRVNLIQYHQHCFNDGIRDAEDLQFRQDVEDILLDLYKNLQQDGSIPGKIFYA